MKYKIETFKKWIKWVEQIRMDLTYLIHNEQIYDEFVKVVNENFDHIKKNEGLIFCNWVRKCYGVQAAVGIRRHVRLKKDGSISLIKLLDQLSKCAKQITYNAYLNIYPVDGFEWQKSTFCSLSEDREVLSEKIIKQDFDGLKKIDKTIGGFVDKVYAHLDKKSAKNKITFDELKKAIQVFNNLACRYIVFFTGNGYHSLKPTIQSNWMQIFRVPFDIRKKED